MNIPNSTDATVEDVFLRTLKLTQGLADGDAATFQHPLTRCPKNLRRTLAVIGNESPARPKVLRTLLGVEDDCNIASLRDGWIPGALIEYEARVGDKIAYFRIDENGGGQTDLNADEFCKFATYHPHKSAIYRVRVSGPFPNCAAGLVVVDTPPTDRTPAPLMNWPASLELRELTALVRVDCGVRTDREAGGVEAALRRWERFCPIYRVSDSSPDVLGELMEGMRRLPTPPSHVQLREKVIEYLTKFAAPVLRSIADSTSRATEEQQDQRFRRELGWYLREFRCAAEELILEQKRNLKNDLRLQLLAHPLTKTGLILKGRREALLGAYFASQLGPRIRLLIKRQAILLERTIDRFASSANADGTLDSVSRLWLEKVKEDVDLRGATASVLIAASPLMFAAAASTAADIWDMGKLSKLSKFFMPATPLPRPNLSNDFGGIARAFDLDKVAASANQTLDGVYHHLDGLHHSVSNLGNILVTGFQILLVQQIFLGIGQALVGMVKVKEHFVLQEMEEEIDRVLEDIGHRLDQAICEFEIRLLPPSKEQSAVGAQEKEANALLDIITTWPRAKA